MNKLDVELSYWIERKEKEGTLKNNHYKYFFTDHFGIDSSFYKDKVLLDIGCGPRGSLLWAVESCKIGLDPLATKYLKFISDKNTTYINGTAERIPIKDSKVDVVSMFNSLDHVDNVFKTIEEIKRITKAGGIFLLLVEVNHKPKICEPHTLNQKEIIKLFKPEFDCREFDLFKPVLKSNMYGSIKMGEKYKNPFKQVVGYLSALFKRKNNG
jgi:ubiquinone/menaquinone biosynthesis C-methylase UbiE